MFFKDGQSNGVIQFYRGPSLVAMATQFGTKLAITRLVKKISAKFLRLLGVFGDGPLNAANRILPRLTRCNGNFTQRSNNCNNIIS